MTSRNNTTSWRVEIAKAMNTAHDSWDSIVHSTLDSEGLDQQFDPGFGEPFTVWTHTRVYFPVVYDGPEWVGSVPRHPCDERTEHMGGAAAQERAAYGEFLTFAEVYMRYGTPDAAKSDGWVTLLHSSGMGRPVAQPISHGVTYDPATHHVVDGNKVPR